VRYIQRVLIPHDRPDDSGIRLEVAKANWALPATGLVTMHSGNASGYDPASGLVYIKPSGMDYEQIKPNNLAVVRLDTGEVLNPEVRPSVDLPHHLFLYRNMPEVRGIIHTHSNYATAFAAVGESIPCCLTAICDEFGGEIPCMPYTDNEGENIGQAILAHRNSRTPAILLGNHGVFAWGASPKSALKAAVMVEDVAKTVWLARQLGAVRPIPAEEAEKWYDRYQNRYGQPA
jgi:L-ribulose-5-phosphate 4-epimerase